MGGWCSDTTGCLPILGRDYGISGGKNTSSTLTLRLDAGHQVLNDLNAHMHHSLMGLGSITKGIPPSDPCGF